MKKLPLLATLLMISTGVAAVDVIKDLPVSHLSVASTSQSMVDVEGVLTNNTNKTLLTVSVMIPLYDAEGVQIGTAGTAAAGIQPGGKLRFRAPASPLGTVAKVGKPTVVATAE